MIDIGAIIERMRLRGLLANERRLYRSPVAAIMRTNRRIMCHRLRLAVRINARFALKEPTND